MAARGERRARQRDVPGVLHRREPVVAVAGDGGHGGCTTIAEHQQLQQQVERLIDLVRQLTERITGRSAGHYHDATGYEDTLCQCPSPGTYAPQWPQSATITEENR